MSKNEVVDKLNIYKGIIDKAIVDYFKDSYKLNESLIYATDGGKRIRAILYLETISMLGRDYTKNDIQFALAIEMIHAYSLVHDDLPQMDNDDIRRGKASVFKKFGEDIAILTGDALLNEAARLLFDLSINDPSYLKASENLLNYAGHRGMIEGQVLDLHSPEKPDKEYIFNVYEKKTSNLFMASAEAGGLVLKTDQQKQKKLSEFAKNLGYAFQIQDDLLEESYENELNILNIMDEKSAKDLLEDINDKVKENLSYFDNNEFFMNLTDYLLKRDK